MEQEVRIDAWEDPALERELDRELIEVDAAVELVRSGMAHVVTIANLRHVEEVLERLRGRNVDAALELEPWIRRGQDPGELEVRLVSV